MSNRSELMRISRELADLAAWLPVEPEIIGILRNDANALRIIAANMPPEPPTRHKYTKAERKAYGQAMQAKRERQPKPSEKTKAAPKSPHLYRTNRQAP